MFSVQLSEDPPQRKICAKTGAFSCFEVVIEHDSIVRRVECYRQKTAITSVRVPAVVVEWARCVVFGIIDPFYFITIGKHVASSGFSTYRLARQ